MGMVLDYIGMCEPAGWQQGKISEARLCSVFLVPLGYSSAHTYITELMQKTDEQSVSIDEAEYPTLWLYKKNKLQKHTRKLFDACFESL